ncbi:MAG: TonB-dependent receptor, partial [Pseudomonadota bacterium]
MGQKVSHHRRNRFQSTTASALVITLAYAGLGIVTPGHAQQSDSDVADEAQRDVIRVIGEKIDRSYQQSFTSVGLLTSEEIKNSTISDTNDAFDFMANVRSFASRNGNNGFMIRGVNADGITQPANSAALISVNIDGVSQSAEGLKRGSRGIWDAEQIEVLRGPQSTLQGRNALAGAVVIKTKDPTWTPELSVRGIFGELDRREAAVAASGPIIDDVLAVRISSEYRRKTTDISLTDPANQPLIEDKFSNVRGKVLYQPHFSDDLTILLTVNHTTDFPTSAPVSGPNFFDRVFTRPSSSVELRDMEVTNYSANISYDISDGITLRSISAFNDTELSIKSAPSSTDFVRSDTREDGDFTQEVRLEISEPIAGLTGVAGLFYGSFSQEIDTSILIGGLPYQVGTFENDVESLAAYIDLRYSLLENLSIIFGGRFQHDDVGNGRNIISIVGNSNSRQESGFDVFLPKAGVSYDITPNQTIAATLNRGYRQGFVEVEAGAPTILNPVDPEFMLAYELAYRASGFNDRLTFGTNVFYNDYTDQQIAVFHPTLRPLSNTRNAIGSSSYGAEIEARFNVGNGLRVFGALGVLETK